MEGDGLAPATCKIVRHGVDITNPRNWYILLSEKIRNRNGAIEYSHPDDNTFLPQLALDLGLSYHKPPSYHKRLSFTNRYANDCKRDLQVAFCKEKTVSTLTSFYNKEFPDAVKKQTHVTFHDAKAPVSKRPDSLPKLVPHKIPGTIPETSLVNGENMYHSHMDNLDEWFSQMPDDTTTKAKRKLMEQSVQEYVKQLSLSSSVPLPKLAEPLSKTMQDSLDIFRLSCPPEDEHTPVSINRKLYRLQLKSLLHLNDSGTSFLEKIDNNKRGFIAVSAIQKADQHKHHNQRIEEVLNDDDDVHCSDTDSQSELGFDPNACPLFIVNTKRDLSLNMDIDPSKPVFSGPMPRQKKLKRLKTYSFKRVPGHPSGSKEGYGSVVLRLDNEEYWHTSRQPQHILESINRKKQVAEKTRETDIYLENETTDVDQNASHDSTNKKKARLINYNKLEIFSEKKPNEETKLCGRKLVDVCNKREMPMVHPPVYRLDPQDKLKRTIGTINNVELTEGRYQTKKAMPLRIVNGVVIVGDAKSE